jgi:hypothetical protein
MDQLTSVTDEFIELPLRQRVLRRVVSTGWIQPDVTQGLPTQ